MHPGNGIVWFVEGRRKSDLYSHGKEESTRNTDRLKDRLLQCFTFMNIS